MIPKPLFLKEFAESFVAIRRWVFRSMTARYLFAARVRPICSILVGEVSASSAFLLSYGRELVFCPFDPAVVRTLIVFSLVLFHEREVPVAVVLQLVSSRGYSPEKSGSSSISSNWPKMILYWVSCEELTLSPNTESYQGNRRNMKSDLFSGSCPPVGTSHDHSSNRHVVKKTGT
ncbi:hypothetical protein YC2023_094382 [Brassica napus]